MTLEELRRTESAMLPLWPEAGTVLNFSRDATYKAAKRGEIPAVKIGSSWRVATVKLREMAGLPPYSSPIAA